VADPAISYTPRFDAAREAEISALAAEYSFAIRTSQAKNKAGGSSAGEDDAREIKNACTANEKYTRT
jgi:hypothetical protein